MIVYGIKAGYVLARVVHHLAPLLDAGHMTLMQVLELEGASGMRYLA